MAVNNPRHSRFFWRSSAMFGILGSERDFKEVNAAWERTLALSTGQLLAKTFLDFVHEEDKPSAKYYFDQLDSGISAVSFSLRFRHNDGSYHQVLWELNNAASTEYAYYVVGMDITAREQPMIADEILSVLEEGVVLQYANGTIGACNPSAEKIIGLSAENMMGWTLIDPDWQTIREDGSPFPAETHPAICTLRTGQAYSNVIMGIVRPDESTLWIRINAYPLWRDDVTTPYAVVISFSDVSGFKERERGLQQDLHQRGNVNALPVLVTEQNYDLWEWHLDTNQVNFSPRWKKMLGFTEDELANHIDTWHQRIHPADYNRVMADIQNHLDGLNRVCESRHRVQHKDGSYRWMLSHAVVVRDLAGKPQRLVGTHIDITETRRLEDDLQETEKKYNQLMELETDGLFLVDAETTEILEVNRSALRMYGYSRSQMLKMKQLELSAQPDKMLQYFKKGIKSSFQQYHKRQDGSVFPVEVLANPFVWRGRQVLLVISRDTTERQNIETALWESESKYRQLFEAASNPTLIFDANTQQIFDINHAAVELYGYTKEEWLHLTTEDISAEPIKRRAAFGVGAKKGQMIPLRWHKKRDGTVFPVEISVGNTYLFQGRSLVCATLRDITERKAAEEALRKERDFINTLVQASPAFFFALNPDGKTRMMNKAMLTALGYAAEEIVDKDYLQTFVSAQERPLVSSEFQNLIKSMQPSLMESHIVTKGGKPLLVEWHSRAIVRADGALDYLFGIGIDVTDRKKAQGHLRLFKSIVESSSEAIAISNPEGQMVYINPAYERLFGRSLKEAQGLKVREMYTAETLGVLEKEATLNLSRGGSWEGEVMAFNKEGEVVPLWERMDAVRDANGNILFNFGLMHDISERKRMWDTLRKQWEEQQMIFNTVPAMIWYRDKDNRLVKKNQLAIKIFGEDDGVVEKFTDCEEIIQLGKPQYGVVQGYRNKAGQTCWMQLDKIPYRDSEGHILGVIVFATDITEYKQSQVSLQASEERMYLVVEHMPLMLNAFDSEGQLLIWNRACEEITGYRADEVVGNAGALALLYPDEAERGLMLAGSTVLGKHDAAHWETHVACKDGSVKTIAWTSVCHQFPIPGWCHWHLGLDVTEQRRVEKATRESESLMASVLGAAKLGVSLTDDRGRFLRVNRAYADLLGYREEDLLGQPFTLVLPSSAQSDAVREYYSLLMTHDEPTLIKQRVEQRRDGKLLAVQVMSSRVILEDRRRLLVSIVNRN